MTQNKKTIRNNRFVPLRPDSYTRQYQRLIRRYVGMLKAELEKYVNNVFKKDEEGDGDRAQEIAEIITILLLFWNSRKTEVPAEIQSLFNKVNSFNDAQFVKMIKAISGLSIIRANGEMGQTLTNPKDVADLLGEVDVYRLEPFLPALRKTWQDNQLTYVDESIRKLIIDSQGIMTTGILLAATNAEIQKQLDGLFTAAENRMYRGVSEQITVLDSSLDRNRQKSFRGKAYEWVTMRDERVRGTPGGKYPKARPSHFHRDTLIFYWSDPPQGGHPGEAEGCRCKAVMRLMRQGYTFTMARRFDSVRFTAQKTDEGFLIDSPVVGRTGILVYRNADGSERRELRLPEDVFHADSLKSFAGKPITVNHPSGKVTSKNVKSLMVGTMLSASKLDDDKVQTNIVIYEPEHIGENRELSLGYDVTLEETPGEWNGQRDDAIQRNISVNHLSIVKRARAGQIARLNVDSDEEIDIIDSEPQRPIMPKLRLDTGIEYETPPEVIAAYTKMNTDMAALQNTHGATTVSLEKMTAERDTLKARVDNIDAEIKAAVDKQAAQLKLDSEALAAVAEVAKSYNIDCNGKQIKDIKIAVITAANPSFKADGKSDVYIDAAFDMVPAKRADQAMQAQRQAVNGNVQQTQQKADAGEYVDPADAWRQGLAKRA